MNTNQLTICSTSIRQDAEGRYCLNDLHRAAGSEARHRPNYFLARMETDELRLVLQETAPGWGLPGFRYAPSVVVINDGINNGTFVVKELVYAYAMWISPKFHLQVIRAYDAMVMTAMPQAVAVKAPGTLKEALKLAYEQAEQLEVLEAANVVLALEVSTAAPKVAVFDAVVADKVLFVNSFAKMLHGVNTNTNQLTTFAFTPGLNLRTITRDGEPWFVAADVCRALGMDTTSGATKNLQGLDADEMNTTEISGGKPGNPRKIIVSESGLYSLILRSRKPAAREFKRWVTGTVLPTIRKTGMYLTPKVAKEVVERPEVFLARALVLAHDTINGLAVQAEGIAADVVGHEKLTITVGLCSEGSEIADRMLKAFARTHGIDLEGLILCRTRSP